MMIKLLQEICNLELMFKFQVENFRTFVEFGVDINACAGSQNLINKVKVVGVNSFL